MKSLAKLVFDYRFADEKLDGSSIAAPYGTSGTFVDRRNTPWLCGDVLCWSCLSMDLKTDLRLGEVDNARLLLLFARNTSNSAEMLLYLTADISPVFILEFDRKRPFLAPSLLSFIAMIIKPSTFNCMRFSMQASIISCC